MKSFLIGLALILWGVLGDFPAKDGDLSIGLCLICLGLFIWVVRIILASGPDSGLVDVVDATVDVFGD